MAQRSHSNRHGRAYPGNLHQQRSHDRRKGQTLLAAVCTTAGLMAWALLVAPMNTVLNGWTPATLPPGWTARRDQRELGHAIHAALFGVEFVALLGAMVAMRNGERDGAPCCG